MKFTIKTRDHGEITFSRPGRGYVYVDLNGQHGTLGNQICAGGDIMGETISYRGDSEEIFKKICRKWWRQHKID